jgi:hypothetical protein
MENKSNCLLRCENEENNGEVDPGAIQIPGNPRSFGFLETEPLNLLEISLCAARFLPDSEYR